MDFSAIQYRDPESSRRARNITSEGWERLRGPISRLHHAGCTKQQIIDNLLSSGAAAQSGLSPSMNQLVRQMKRWNLVADTRNSLVSLTENRDDVVITDAQAELAVQSSYGTSTPDLVDDEHSSGSNSSMHEPSDVQMLDVDDTIGAVTTLSTISPRSSKHTTGPVVVDKEAVPDASVSGLDDVITLTETASLSSSIRSGIRHRLSRAINYGRISTGEHSDKNSVKSTFTISTHSSWSFGRVTGLMSTPRSLSRMSHDRVSSVVLSEVFNTSGPSTEPRKQIVPATQTESFPKHRLEPIWEETNLRRRRDHDFYREGRIYQCQSQKFAIIWRLDYEVWVVGVYDGPEREAFERMSSLIETTPRIAYMAYSDDRGMCKLPRGQTIPIINIQLKHGSVQLIEPGIADFSQTTVFHIVEMTDSVYDHGVVAKGSMPVLRRLADRLLPETDL